GGAPWSATPATRRRATFDPVRHRLCGRHGDRPVGRRRRHLHPWRPPLTRATPAPSRESAGVRIVSSRTERAIRLPLRAFPGGALARALAALRPALHETALRVASSCHRFPPFVV